MFTGIVEEVGQVASLSDYRLVIQAKTVLEDVHVGDSISVNGACLTVVEFNTDSFAVDLAPETLRRTSLGQVGPERRSEPRTRSCRP